MSNYVFHHLHLKSGTRSGLSNPLLSKTDCLTCWHPLLGHSLYHLHIRDDYTFPSKLLIKVLSNAEPRTAPYALQFKIYSTPLPALLNQRFPIYSEQSTLTVRMQPQRISQTQTQLKLCPAAFF